VRNVSVPTVTVYAPKSRNTGAAVVVFPGGGYQLLAIDLEGTEVCDWLTSRGITGILLKYRVPNGGPTWDQNCGCDRNTQSSMPLEDAQRAIAIVRAHARAWHIDPHKIGVLGFSAGGHMVATTSTHFEDRAYTAVDAADSQSCRPISPWRSIPGICTTTAAPGSTRTSRSRATRQPTFLLHAENDKVDGVSNTLVYYDELKNAGVEVELHLYAEGGHAFGLRATRLPISSWPRLVETWLRTIGMISAP
jgi:acetyl esterase/lipase